MYTSYVLSIAYLFLFLFTYMSFYVYKYPTPALQSGFTKEQLHEKLLFSVSPNFRVIALGLPVPEFPGYPLDPPLRSRFQARVITSSPLQETLHHSSYVASVSPPSLQWPLPSPSPSPRLSLPHLSPLIGLHGPADEEMLSPLQHSLWHGANLSIHTTWTQGYRSIISCLQAISSLRNGVHTSTSSSSSSSASPASSALAFHASKFPAVPSTVQRDVLKYIAAQSPQELRQSAPDGFFDRLLHLVYPYSKMGLDASHSHAMKSVCDHVSLQMYPYSKNDHKSPSREISANDKSEAASFQDLKSSRTADPNTVLLPQHLPMIQECMQAYRLGGDMCIVGGKGEGKSALLDSVMAQIVEVNDGKIDGAGREDCSGKVDVICCYKDMTSRDLLMRRR